MPEHPPQGATLAGVGLIIVLPRGFELGGVTTWARRTRDAVAQAGGVCVMTGPWIGDDAPAGIEPLAESIRAAMRGLCTAGVDRVIIAPQLSGDAYAAACVAAHEAGDPGVSLVGWMHTDIRHDVELVRRFSPGLARVVCVSQAAAGALLRENACDAAKAVVASTGVPIQPHAPVAEGPAASPLRLLYVGRLDAFQKRVLAIPHIVQGLRRSGIRCTMTVVGDGPAHASLTRQAAVLGGIEMRGPLETSRLAEVYAAHDFLLLPSRSEGLGLARIEAAMHGCVPIVTPGGAAEGITHACNGFIAECPPHLDDLETADRFAGTIIRALDQPLAPIRAECVRSARADFDMDSYAASLALALHGARTTKQQGRWWARPAKHPHAFARFTIPENAPLIIAAGLADLSGRRVVLHGAGAHTSAIWESVHRLGLQVVAIADDDPQRWGDRLFGIPVISPAMAGDAGASVVVISSWLHEDEIWSRRGIYECVGLAVRRIYAQAPAVQAVG